ADRVVAAVDDGDPARHRRRSGRRGGDLRVRLPAGGAPGPHRVDQQPARGPDTGGDRRRGHLTGGSRGGSLPPRRGRPGGPRGRPRRDPGPVRGVRRRRERGRRRAEVPRQRRAGGDDGPAHPRGGLRLHRAARRRLRARGCCQRAGRRVHRPARGGRSGGRRPSAVARARPGVDRPAVRARSLGPADDRERRRRPGPGCGGREVLPRRLGGRRSEPARRGRRGAVRLRPRRVPGPGGRARRGRPPPRPRAGLGGRRQRLLRPPGSAARGGCRGPGRGPAPRRAGPSRPAVRRPSPL
ncbi:MAG: ABC transporter, substrate-binding protein (cluster 8, B12/iron complex), partial [uncultured Nocardioidaceae bacterium]